MKKIIIFILIALIAVGVGFGVYALVSKNNTYKDNKDNLTARIDLLEDEYAVGEKMILRIIATADVQFTSLKYAINNGEEVALNVTTGKSADLDKAIGSGKYYVDSGAEIIDTTSMTAGYYTLVIYAYDANEARYVITADPIVFRLTSTQAAA